MKPTTVPQTVQAPQTEAQPFPLGQIMETLQRHAAEISAHSERIIVAKSTTAQMVDMMAQHIAALEKANAELVKTNAELKTQIAELTAPKPPVADMTPVPATAAA